MSNLKLQCNLMRIVHGLLIEQPNNTWSIWNKTLSLICPLTYDRPTKHVNHNRGEIDLSNTQEYNGPNSISKNALRDEDYLWLINWTTQEYLINVRQDSLFNTWFLYLRDKSSNRMVIEIMDGGSGRRNMTVSFFGPWYHSQR